MKRESGKTSAGMPQTRYSNLIKQKTLGILGTVFLVYGFILQAIAIVPYQTHLSQYQISLTLLTFHFIFLIFSIFFYYHEKYYYKGIDKIDNALRPINHEKKLDEAIKKIKEIAEQNGQSVINFIESKKKIIPNGITIKVAKIGRGNRGRAAS